MTCNKMTKFRIWLEFANMYGTCWIHSTHKRDGGWCVDARNDCVILLLFCANWSDSVGESSRLFESRRYPVILDTCRTQRAWLATISHPSSLPIDVRIVHGVLPRLVDSNPSFICQRTNDKFDGKRNTTS